MNTKRKILLVFGTRPEAIKVAPVIQILRDQSSKLSVVICVTAQHREMLDQVLRIFDIKPDYDLNIMKDNQDLFDVTTNALKGLREVMIEVSPDMVLVQGDTTTAFVAGLAAFYLKIPVGHIEAGLRTHNKYSPFPEEKNRHLLSALTDYHFAPTEWSGANLLKEGVAKDRIWVTGNTVIDALLSIVKRQESGDKQEFLRNYFKVTHRLDLNDNGKLILVTGHRRENFGSGFENICLALKEIAARRADVNIVYPVHLNPNVREPVKRILNDCVNIRLIEPLEYEPFVYLMNKSYLILTDSGGIQEEAPSLGKPVLVMRDTTERPEGIEAGTVKLVGTKKDSIISDTIELLELPLLYKKMSKATNPYGDGLASQRILNILENLYQEV